MFGPEVAPHSSAVKYWRLHLPTTGAFEQGYRRLVSLTTLVEQYKRNLPKYCFDALDHSISVGALLSMIVSFVI